LRAEFEIDEWSGQVTTANTVLAVKDTEVLYISACKYEVFKIERSESRGDEPLHLRDTDYFSPELKLVIAKAYKERDGTTTLIKFDRIYPMRN
jgi:hypothetical protein